MENTLHIDIASVLESKSKKLARFTPSFLIRYLERIVHQKELNEVLELHGHKPGIEFVRGCFDYLDIKFCSVGLDKLPKSGRYLFVSNHPFGGLDGMMLVDELAEYFGEAMIVANDLLMNITPMHDLFVPVNKHGGQSREVLARFREAMNSDAAMASFPAGLCSRKIGGEIVDLPWKTTFLKDAIKSKRDIVPVYFDGQLSKFFYRLSNLRKNLGVKFNIEMLYLVDEMYKQQGGRFEIRFGEPMPYTEFESSRNLKQDAQMVRDRVYQMRKQK